jgi:hypothetical protein
VERAAVVVARGAELEHRRAAQDGERLQLFDEPRLADARLALDQDRAGASVLRERPRLREAGERLVPAEERREAAQLRHVERGADVVGPDHAEERHRLRDALQRLGADALELEPAAHEALGRPADEDRVAVGGRLHARGDDGRIAHGEVGPVGPPRRPA